MFRETKSFFILPLGGPLNQRRPCCITLEIVVFGVLQFFASFKADMSTVSDEYSKVELFIY